MSNALLTREVLRPRPRLSTAIVRVPLAGCSPEALTTIANLVAMTPGEMPVEVEADPPVMYVHVLQFTLGRGRAARHLGAARPGARRVRHRRGDRRRPGGGAGRRLGIGDGHDASGHSSGTGAATGEDP